LTVSSLAALPAAAQRSLNGERVYQLNCASCHDTGQPQVPSRETLVGFTPAYIENALSSFGMRQIGETLSHAERRVVAEFAAGAPAGSLPAPLEQIPRNAYCSANPNVANPLAGPAWNGWSPDNANSRFQREDAGLSADDVPDLTLQWAFGVPGVTASGSHVTVVGERLYFGARNGIVYSLDKKTGCVAWTFEADGGVRSTPVVADDSGTSTVFFGDAFGNVYALDALTGEPRWREKLDSHAVAMITGALVYHEGRLYVPVSSLEEGASRTPSYECCTFRGSLVSLDADSGKEIWRTRMIARGSEPTGVNRAGARTWGPSGAAIWSAPTLDPDNNRIYVTTGDNYSLPATGNSDAVMALALDTGAILWTQQTLPGDAWTASCLEARSVDAVNCPEGAGPDYDFGSSAALATTADGSSVLLAGQKSGVLFGLDPEDGDLLWQHAVSEGGVLGGIEWGFATDGDVAYVATSEAFEQSAGDAGGLHAVDVRDGSAVWYSPPSQDSCANRNGCNTAQPGAVSAIEGVVFAGSLDGHLRAHAAETGEVMWDFDTVREFATVNGVPAHGGALSGPGVAIAGGMLFVSSGYSNFGMMPGNVLLAFGTDDD
jgi:polyvinyl alcohol dehydrogenase (cytochrome)